MFKIYARKFQSVSGGQLGKFLIQALGISSRSGRRAVWVNKRPADRHAEIRFADDVDLSLLVPLTSNTLEFKSELIKCESISTISEEGTKKARKSIDQLVLPWSDVPYSEQLIRKQQTVTDAISSALAGVCASAKARNYTPLPVWSATADLTIAPTADENQNYRNKCEFSFGMNSDGIPEIGFVLERATNTSEPVIAAGELLPHVSLHIAKIVSSLRFFLLAQVATFPIFSHVNKQGWWRICMIRACPRSGEVQVVLQIGEQEDIEEFEKKWIEWAKNENITSLFLQINSSVTDTIVMSDLHVLRLLYGPSTIRMILKSQNGEITFHTNPMSFFQTNTFAAEMLLDRVVEHCQTTMDCSGSLLDICCGVGTIGQYVSKSISLSLIGIDIVEEAIDDAKRNALDNNLKNFKYHCGRAESVLPEIIDSVDAICVVDPPRSGLHKSVINAIRENEKLKSVIYVSCNPKSLAEDLVRFCEPLTSSPDEEGIAVNMKFEPIKFVAVDMFPGTPHCETVVLLKR